MQLPRVPRILKVKRPHNAEAPEAPLTAASSSTKLRCVLAAACLALVGSLVALLVVLLRVSALEAAWSPPLTSSADAILTAPLPANDTEIVLIAHGSCANQRIPAPYWATNAGLDPQLFIFNGDIIYADCYTDGAIDGCPNLAEGWAAFAEHDDIAVVADTLPMVGMLDDHDYGMNDCSASNPFKQLAKEHFLHRFGAPQNDVRRTRPGLHKAYSFGPAGRRTQVILLDTRWFRSPFASSPCHRGNRTAARVARETCDCAYCAGIERYVPYTAEEEAAGHYTMLGESQWRWLEEQLREPADVRLVVSTVQVLAEGHGWERWGMIPSELVRLQRLIHTTRANGVVLLSGDRHIGALYKLPATGGEAPYPLYEATASSLTHSSRSGCVLEGKPGCHAEDLPLMLQPATDENNVGTVAIDWEARTVTLGLVASDDCGMSPQPWGKVCEQHRGHAGLLLQHVTINLDELRA